MKCTCAISRLRRGTGRVFLLSSCIVFAVWTESTAQDVSVSGRLGSLGLGVEAGVTMLDRVGARIGFNAFSVSFDAEEDDIDYEYDVRLSTVSFLADVYVWKSGLRVTAGLFSNMNRVDMVAQPQNELEIGDEIYTPAEAGTLSGRIDFENVNPFLGIGIDTRFADSRGVGFVADLGAFFLGSPNVDLRANGPIASDPVFQANLASERRKVEDDIRDFTVYPVLMLGMSYHF